MKPPTHVRNKSAPARGFALIVTLSLMILLMTAVVGLLTLSSISSRQARASRAMAIAQSNARMALCLALGELQSQAGPDQRITATADMAADVGGTRLATGKDPVNKTSITDATVDKGLSLLQSGTRYWTGVWKNNSTAPANEIFTKTPSPVLAKWLISGNEGGKQFTPATASCSVNSAGKLADPKAAVILVGQHSVGAAAATTLDQYIAAPLVEIRNAGTSQATGRYAWWVGDEGVKSRINLPKIRTDSKKYTSLPAQRRGWETVTGFTADTANYPLPNDALQTSLPKIINLPATPLLLPALKTETLQSIFHSATSDSKAVIADTLAGGTRVDLSAVFAKDLPSSVPATAKTIANYPLKDGLVIPKTAGTPGEKLRAPVWNTLKEFHDSFATLSGGSLVVQAASGPNSPSIAPLVTDFRILMGARLVPKGGAAAAASAIRPSA